MRHDNLQFPYGRRTHHQTLRRMFLRPSPKYDNQLFGTFGNCPPCQKSTPLERSNQRIFGSSCGRNTSGRGTYLLSKLHFKHDGSSCGVWHPFLNFESNVLYVEHTSLKPFSVSFIHRVYYSIISSLVCRKQEASRGGLFMPRSEIHRPTFG